RADVTPIIAALGLGGFLAMCWLGRPGRKKRMTKAEKRALRFAKRKESQAAKARRAFLKRKNNLSRQFTLLGVEEFKKMRQKQRQMKAEQMARLCAAMHGPGRLVLAVDLSWAETARENDVANLGKQLCYVYSDMKSSLDPPALTLAPYSGRTANILNRVGARSWMVHRHTTSVFEALGTDLNIIYLSPDAEEPLAELLPGEQVVYVVGGVVDRTRHAGWSLLAARAEDVRCARLPFQEHLPWVIGADRVLTVCAVIKALMMRYSGMEWPEVLEKNLPQRGRKRQLQLNGNRVEGDGAAAEEVEME
ncbi:unnamed protein product, partial [Choristocarpus tenellus]